LVLGPQAAWTWPGHSAAVQLLSSFARCAPKAEVKDEGQCRRSWVLQRERVARNFEKVKEQM
jgi:hypothetical protein